MSDIYVLQPVIEPSNLGSWMSREVDKPEMTVMIGFGYPQLDSRAKIIGQNKTRVVTRDKSDCMRNVKLTSSCGN